MKDKFKVFYEVSENDLPKIWKSNETIFIFDTNILLNLYQYSQETQDDFFKILNEVKGRIWIPFHVALEYQRRRLRVIRDEKSVFDEINKKLNEIKKVVDSDFSKFKLKSRNTKLFDNEEDFKKSIHSLIDKFKLEVDEVDKSQPCVRTNDNIRTKLDNLLKGKIGEEPKEEWVLNVAKEGEVRYENKIPPGYEDESKEKDLSKANFIFNNITYERKFGDLIIWKQIIEHVKTLNNIQNVIFVTDDSKEDWWEVVQSRGEKKIGARPELKSEIYKAASIEHFKMYHTNDFLAAARKYCNISINDKAIEETKNLFNSLESRILYQQQLDDIHNDKIDFNAENSSRQQLARLREMRSLGLIDDKIYKERVANIHNDKIDFNAENPSRQQLARLREMRSLGFIDDKIYKERVASLYSDKIDFNAENPSRQQLDRLREMHSLGVISTEEYKKRLANLHKDEIGSNSGNLLQEEFNKLREIYSIGVINTKEYEERLAELFKD